MKAEGQTEGRLWRPTVAISLLQVSLGMVRPAISYQALESGGDAMAIGLIAAAYAALPMLFAIAIGSLAGRLARIALVPVVSTVVVVAGIALCLATTELWWLGAASALIGIGNIGALLGAQAWVSRSAPASRYDSVFGWMTATMSLGQAVGPLLGGFLLAGLGSHPTSQGIQAAFWVALGITLAAAVVFCTRGRRVYSEAAQRETARSTREIILLPGVARYVYASAVVLTTIDILSAYLPAVGDAHGIPPAVVGILLGVRGLTSMISRIFLGAMTRRWDRVALSAVATAGSAVAIASIAIAPLFAVLLPAMIIGGFLLGIIQPLTISSIALAVPERSRSEALAIRLLGNRIAQTTLPAIAGGLGAALGIGAVFWMLTALLGGGAVWLAARRPRGD